MPSPLPTAMAMKAAGIAPIEGLTETVFDDDAEISSSVKGYIATAQKMGLIHGSFDGTGLYFEPNRAVTNAEAAVILCSIANLSVNNATEVFADENGNVPVWAENAVATLYALGYMNANTDGVFLSSESLSRGDCAQMLYGVMMQ